MHNDILFASRWIPNNSSEIKIFETHHALNQSNENTEHEKLKFHAANTRKPDRASEPANRPRDLAPAPRASHPPRDRNNPVRYFGRAARHTASC